MKKIIILSVVLSSVITALLAFDSSNTPSTNYEGLKKTSVLNNPSVLEITKPNNHTFYVQF